MHSTLLTAKAPQADYAQWIQRAAMWRLYAEWRQQVCAYLSPTVLCAGPESRWRVHWLLAFIRGRYPGSWKPWKPMSVSLTCENGGHAQPRRQFDNLPCHRIISAASRHRAERAVWAAG